jgi:hypothetical protein
MVDGEALLENTDQDGIHAKVDLHLPTNLCIFGMEIKSP